MNDAERVAEVVGAVRLLDVPHLRRVVRASRHQERAGGIEGHARHGGVVRLPRSQHHLRLEIPDAEQLISARSDDLFSGRMDGEADDLLGTLRLNVSEKGSAVPYSPPRARPSLLPFPN